MSDTTPMPDPAQELVTSVHAAAPAPLPQPPARATEVGFISPATGGASVTSLLKRGAAKAPARTRKAVEEGSESVAALATTLAFGTPAAGVDIPAFPPSPSPALPARPPPSPPPPGPEDGDAQGENECIAPSADLPAPPPVMRIDLHDAFAGADALMCDVGASGEVGKEEEEDGMVVPAPSPSAEMEDAQVQAALTPASECAPPAADAAADMMEIVKPELTPPPSVALASPSPAAPGNGEDVPPSPVSVSEPAPASPPQLGPSLPLLDADNAASDEQQAKIRFVKPFKAPRRVGPALTGAALLSLPRPRPTEGEAATGAGADAAEAIYDLSSRFDEVSGDAGAEESLLDVTVDAGDVAPSSSSSSSSSSAPAPPLVLLRAPTKKAAAAFKMPRKLDPTVVSSFAAASARPVKRNAAANVEDESGALAGGGAGADGVEDGAVAPATAGDADADGDVAMASADATAVAVVQLPLKRKAALSLKRLPGAAGNASRVGKAGGAVPIAGPRVGQRKSGAGAGAGAGRDAMEEDSDGDLSSSEDEKEAAAGTKRARGAVRA
jgi:hypothetical protein